MEGLAHGSVHTFELTCCRAACSRRTCLAAAAAAAAAAHLQCAHGPVQPLRRCRLQVIRCHAKRLPPAHQHTDQNKQQQ
jgi:hypothetical protein